MTTLNPADATVDVFLTNGNLTMQCLGGGHYMVRSTTSKTTGKAFIQFHIDSYHSGGIVVVGLANATASLTTPNYVSIDTNSGGWASSTGGWYWNGSGSIDFPTVTSSGHDVGMGFDFDTGTVQINVDGGSFTSHAESFPTGPLFLIVDIQYSDDQLTFNFGGSSFVGSPPSGYAAWDGASQISGSLNSTLDAATSSATANAIISGVLTH